MNSDWHHPNILNVRKQFFCFVLFCSVLAGSGVGAIITDRYAHQSIKCQYKSQFLVDEGKCMTCYYKNVWNAITL